MRPLGRRDMQDGERNPSWKLHKRSPPLHVEGQAEKVGNRVPIAAHRDAGENADVGSSPVMTRRGCMRRFPVRSCMGTTSVRLYLDAGRGLPKCMSRKP